jgi:hypothetical protein
MKTYRHPAAMALLALAAAACSGADRSPTAAATTPVLDAIPPAWASTCALIVRFNPPPIGAVFGAPVPQPPGSLAFVENTVSVRTAWFNDGFAWLYDQAIIEPAPATPFGDGKVARMRNMSFRYTPPSTAGPFYEAIFEFRDLGGVENLSVNGHPLYIGNIAALPNPYSLWNTGVSTAPVPGGIEGTVRIRGKDPIKDLLVGGQEFWIDNICFR